MAANQTENYGLNQWLATDQVMRTDFNADNAKIDAALAGLSETAAEKADQSALNALTEQLAQKADVSALNQVQVSIPKLVTGTYVGTGDYGEDHPNSLDFSSGLGRPPMLVIIRPEEGSYVGLILVRGMTESDNHFTNSYLTGASNTVQWIGNKIIWYAGNATGQLDYYGVTYRYFAIG